MKSIILSVVLSVLPMCVAFAQAEGPRERVVREIRNWVKDMESDSVMSRAAWSLTVRDMKDGRVVVEKDSEMLLAAASITKLLTTGAALTALGEEFTYKTSIEYSGEVKDSTLHGTLYIVGGGDPTLGTTYGELKESAAAAVVFEQWKKALKGAGIARLEGRVVADDRYFPFEPAISSWSWDDVSQTFGTGVRGLSFHDNLVTLYIKPAVELGHTPVVDSTYPSIHNLEVNSDAVTVEKGYNTMWIENSPLHMGHYFLHGNMPIKYSSRRITMPNRASGLSLAVEFMEYLTGQDSPSGVEYVLWDSGVQVLDTLEHKHICTYESPSLSQIAALTNKYSDNMYAETILRTIGKELGKGGSTSQSLNKEREILDSIAPGVKMINKLDGSGLSRNASLCTEYYTRFLYGMKGTEAFDAFYKSLAVPGEAGTYRSSLKDVPTRDRLHLKSGSLSIARATAGYAGEEEDMLCFSLIVNRYSDGGVVKKRIDELLEILSRYAN